MRINTKEMVDRIYKDNKKTITKQDISTILNSHKDIVSEELIKDNSVIIYGLGTFSLIDIPKRKYRNISTNTTFESEATKRPKFKYSKSFKILISTTHSK